jgi:hypothetical protein
MSAFLVATGNRSREPKGAAKGKRPAGLEGQGESYVRRHEKASSAGSNSDRIEGPGPLSRPGAMVALLLALIATACLLPGSALAAEARLPLESFGPDGTSGTSFSFPGALAFDQGEEHLHALDQGSAQIHGFDTAGPATHTPLGGSFPLTAPGSEPGYLDDLAADSSSHDLYYLSEAKAFSAEPSLYGFDAAGAPRAGNFPIGGFGDPCGAAVDPSGHVWVAGSVGSGVVGLKEYDSAGNPIGTISTAQGFPCRIAFDSEANLYVGMYFGPTWRYDAAGGYGSATQVDPAASAALTVDRSTDRLYVAHSGRVSVYDPDGSPLYEFGADVAGAEYAGIAVDEAGEEVYVSDRANGKIQVFGAPVTLPDVRTQDADGVTATAATLHGTVDTAGGPEAECEFQYVANDEVQALTVSATEGTFRLSFEGQSTSPIAFDAPAGEVRNGLRSLSTIGGVGGSVKVRGGPGDETGSTPYTIAFGGALAHTNVEAIATEATSLEGGSAEVTTINQGKSPGFAEATGVPCEPAGLISGSEAVSADLAGLLPDATYHFRLLARTTIGTASGADRSFITAAGPPVIGAQSIEVVGTSDVTLGATINPQGAPTTYHVEYGTSASYGQSTAESLPIGFEGDDSDHTVSVHIGGLQPGTPYHFRFVATSPAGSDEGTDTTFATYPVPPTFGPCPNDQFRTGPGAGLPDCRAYEQATPTDKHGAHAQGRTNTIQASGAGDRVTFFVNGGLPTTGGNTGLYPFMASRGPAGWSSDGLQPLTDAGFGAGVLGWSGDLSTTVATAPGPGNVGAAIYLRDSDTAAYAPGPAAPGAFFPSVADFAADTSHLIFEASANILPGAPAGENNLYDLDHGTLTLVSRVPAGSATSCDDETGPACEPAPEGAFAGPYNWTDSNVNAFGGADGGYYTQNTISRDGSRAFFTAAGSGQLYVREDGTRTTRISASQRTTPDPNGEKPAAFMAATPDGSKVFFTSCEKLTDDSTAFSTGENACTAADGHSEEAFQGQDLYSYDVESGELTDLTVDTNAGDEKGAAVQGVLGASEDGSYVYFAANGVLAPGASPGDCVGGNFPNGPCNLYVSHEGATTFIAPVDAFHDRDDWAPRTRTSNGKVKSSRLSADGTVLLFSSRQSLTGYDNRGATPAICSGSPCPEFFRYDAPEEELACISCNPAGVRPRGLAALASDREFLLDPLRFTFLTRNLSADGDRVFFESSDALLPTDTNGVKDVYEWEAEGAGTCDTAGGCLYLLSSGTSPDPSWFGDASLDGEHAFLFTDEQLVPGDRDQLYDVYDAGIGAGLAAQHALSPPTCTSTACQVNPPPPPDPPASSALFSGPGNPHKRPAARKCPKGKRKVRRAGRVRCQKASKQHKRHSNRGGSK